VLPNIPNIDSSAASSKNLKLNNILSQSIGNSSLLRSSMKKGTNTSGMQLHMALTPLIKKETRFNIDLKIDISNSDKQDLINIISNENINNFTANLAKNSNNKSKENSIINQSHSNIQAENIEISNNKNNNYGNDGDNNRNNGNSSEKNSNLFLTKVDDNINNTKYARFRLNLGNKESERSPTGSSSNLPKETLRLNNNNNNNNNNNQKEKEKLIHDFSVINNFNNKEKEKENSMLWGSSSLINLVSPKNNQTNISNNQLLQNKKSSVTYNSTEASEHDNKYNNNINNNNSYKKQESNLISRIETNQNENSPQSRTRIKGILSPNSKSKTSINNLKYGSSGSPLNNNSINNNKSNRVLKTSLIGNSLINENYDGESEASSPKRSKNSKKSYFDILDLISKDYNLTEVSVAPSTVKNKHRNASEVLYKKNSNNNKTHINNSNYYGNNSDLTDFHVLKTNSENTVEKIDLREKDSFDNFLSSSPRKQRGISGRPQDLHNKAKEFMENFLSKCSSQEISVENHMKRIKNDLKKDNHKFKSSEIELKPTIAINKVNREIDKSVFLMDNNNLNRDKVVQLLASEGKDGKKNMLIENPSSPLFVGELISKINDVFAYKCKTLLLEKLDNPLDARKRQLHQYKNIQEYYDNQARLDIKHKKVEEVLYGIEARKNYAMRIIANTIDQNNDRANIHFKEEK